jgi:hypothetical protein
MDCEVAVKEQSELERLVGINYADLTQQEREAVGGIKSRFYDLSQREKTGSPIDIITDLSVAIVAEIRAGASSGNGVQ